MSVLSVVPRGIQLPSFSRKQDVGLCTHTTTQIKFRQKYMLIEACGRDSMSVVVPLVANPKVYKINVGL